MVTESVSEDNCTHRRRAESSYGMRWVAPVFQMKAANQRPAVGSLRRHVLYEQFGFRENPFGVTPNPRYLYESRTHSEAKASLVIGVECGVGFQALIAPPGMGKTTILFHVLQRFQGDAQTALLFQVQGSSHDFLRYLLSELGAGPVPSEMAGMQDAINQLLIKEFHAGRVVILVIDEAQNLNLEVLETIRMLSNFETASEKMLQIILSGQPQLAQTLAKPELAQLRQRVSMFTTLTPFDEEDTKCYIDHRLRLAGYKGPPLFTERAVSAICKHSQGVPRNINALCFNALLLASSAESQQIDEPSIAEVIRDRDLQLLASGIAPAQPRRVEKFSSASEKPIPDLPMPQHDNGHGLRLELCPPCSDQIADNGSNSEMEQPAEVNVMPGEQLVSGEAAGKSDEEPSRSLPEIAVAEPIQLSPPALDGADPDIKPEAPLMHCQVKTTKRIAGSVSGALVILLLLAVVTKMSGHRSEIASALEHIRPSAVPRPLFHVTAGTQQTSAAPRESRPANDYPKALRASSTASPVLSDKSNLTYVDGVEHYSTGSSTIVVVSLDQRVKLVSQRLNSPDRIFFDLENTKLADRLTGQPSKVNEAAVSRIRVAEHEGAVTRIALVTKELCDYTDRFVANPPRLIIEVRPQNSFSRSAANFSGLE